MRRSIRWRGTRPDWPPGVTRLVGEGYAVTLCAATAAGAGRLSAVLADEGVHAPVADERHRRRRGPAWWRRR